MVPPPGWPVDQPPRTWRERRRGDVGWDGSFLRRLWAFREGDLHHVRGARLLRRGDGALLRLVWIVLPRSLHPVRHLGLFQRRDGPPL